MLLVLGWMTIDSANYITRDSLLEEFKLIHKLSQPRNVALNVISLNCSKSDIYTSTPPALETEFLCKKMYPGNEIEVRVCPLF